MVNLVFSEFADAQRHHEQSHRGCPPGDHPMLGVKHYRYDRYEGENFAAEKAIATLYLIMFVLIVGMGVHTQLLRTAPDAASSAATKPR
jgi:hypothetical protein